MDFKLISNAILFVAGLTLVIFGSLVFVFFPDILQDIIEDHVPLKNGTRAFRRWQKIESPITLSFYFFHLNNSETFTSLDDIELVEKGPYKYKEKRFKKIIEHEDDPDDWISYREQRKYTFVNNSDLDETDEVNLINFPILGMLQTTALEKYKSLLQMAFNSNYLGYFNYNKLPNETSLFIKTSVVDFLFNGLSYDLFNSDFFQSVGIPNKFSIFEGGKDRLEKEWTVNTGERHLDQIYEVHQYNERSNWTNDILLEGEPIWPKHNTDEHNCNRLKGRDSAMFAPDISKHDTLLILEPDSCRSIYLTYWKETEVRDIETYRFRIPDKFYKSQSTVKYKHCYCLEDDLAKCDQDGLLDISRCIRKTMGAPIVYSLPYFFKANERLRKQFGSELIPKKELNYYNYGTYLDIEPRTGYTLEAHKRMQFNLKVKPQNIETMTQLSNSKKDYYYVPIFWVEHHGKISNHQAHVYESEITKYEKMTYCSAIGLIVIGVIMQIISVYIIIKSIKHKRICQISRSNYSFECKDFM